jgi:hypothetical protein
MRPAPATPMRIDVHPMTKSAFFAATAAFVIAAAPGIAGETTPIEWSQLADQSAQEFEDPYRDLAPEQMSDLMSLVRLREELGVEGLAIEERRQLEAGRKNSRPPCRQAGSTSSGCCRNGGSLPIAGGRLLSALTAHLMGRLWRSQVF